MTFPWSEALLERPLYHQHWETVAGLREQISLQRQLTVAVIASPFPCLKIQEWVVLTGVEITGRTLELQNMGIIWFINRRQGKGLRCEASLCLLV